MGKSERGREGKNEERRRCIEAYRAGSAFDTGKQLRGRRSNRAGVRWHGNLVNLQCDPPEALILQLGPLFQMAAKSIQKLRF